MSQAKSRVKDIRVKVPWRGQEFIKSLPTQQSPKLPKQGSGVRGFFALRLPSSLGGSRGGNR